MRKTMALLLSLSVVLLAACSSQPEAPKTGAQAPAATPAEQKAVIAVSLEAATLDPHKSFNGGVFTVTNQIYEPLVFRAADGTLQPRLATKWKAVNETTWELKLRNNVKFSDGTPFNAEAVKFNIERLKAPETKGPGAFIVTMIKEIKVVDDTTVQLITDKPFAPLPAHLSHPVTAMVSPAAAKGDLGKAPVGTGPFTLKEWKASDSITLAANPNYWGGKPALETVVLRTIPEAGTQLVELQAGTVDLITGLQPEKFGELASNNQFAATKFLGWGSMFLGFNTQAGPLAKPEVRQAIAYALDRKAMVEILRQGMAEQAVSMIPKTVFGHATGLKDYTYDASVAKDLLAKAGVATPLKLKLNTYEGAENKQIAGAIQAQLKEIGIDLEVVVTDYAAYAQEIAKPDHGLFLTSWGTVTMDADYAFYSLLHSKQHAADNKSFYANAEVDKWLEEARSTADDKARLELYKNVQTQVQNDLPYLTLYHPLTSYAKNQRLQGEVYPFAAINLDLRKASIK
jgi:peptide/nickel transport system substrate-binding protein